MQELMRTSMWEKMMGRARRQHMEKPGPEKTSIYAGMPGCAVATVSPVTALWVTSMKPAL